MKTHLPLHGINSASRAVLAIYPLFLNVTPSACKSLFSQESSSEAFLYKICPRTRVLLPTYAPLEPQL